MINFEDVEFYFVTDSSLSKKGILSDVEDALKAGCRVVQYREKNKTTSDMIREAKQIKKLCNDRAIFLVNDNVDVALAIDADGVHIGKSDISFKNARRLLGKEKIIGISVDNLDEAIIAETTGADYIGLGPIFETATKKDAGLPCGIKMIENVRKNVNIPLVAIGGITKDNVKAVIESGADVAVAVSAVIGSADVYKEVKDFIRIIKGCKTR